MKNILFLLLSVCLILTSVSAIAQTDTAAMLKRQKEIEKSEKEISNLQAKVNKKDRKMEKAQRRADRKESRREKKLNKLRRAERKHEQLIRDSSQTSLQPLKINTLRNFINGDKTSALVINQTSDRFVNTTRVLVNNTEPADRLKKQFRA